MLGLLPRSLPSPIPYNPNWSSGSLRSSFCGGLRRVSSGHLRCSSTRSLAKSGCCGGFCAGGFAPLGAGVCGSICTGVSSTASPRGSSFLHPSCPGGSSPPPPRWSRQLSLLPSGCCCLHHKYQHGPVLYRPAPSTFISQKESHFPARDTGRPF